MNNNVVVLNENNNDNQSPVDLNAFQNMLNVLGRDNIMFGMYKTIEELKSDLIQANKKADKIIKDGQNRDKTISTISDTVATMSTEVKEIVDKTNVLEFDDSNKLGELKKAAKARVMKIVGGVKSPEYILFYRSYMQQCYANACSQLTGGKKLGKIKVEDYDVALTLVRRWVPLEYNKNRLLDKYIDQQRDKILSQEKSNALDLYLAKKIRGVS